MKWIGLALSFLSGPLGWLGGVGRFLLRNPLVLALALVGLWGLYQHHEATKAREEAAKWHKRADQCQMASQQAQKAQEALHAQERAKYEEQAHEADTRYSADLASVRASTASYIAAHRVQALRASTAQPVSAPGSAGVHEAVPGSDTAVVVSSGDVQACSDWVAYGVAAHDWAVSVTDAGR